MDVTVYHPDHTAEDNVSAVILNVGGLNTTYMDMLWVDTYIYTYTFDVDTSSPGTMGAKAVSSLDGPGKYTEELTFTERVATGLDPYHTPAETRFISE